jgi:kynurenine formamidase
MSKEKVYDIAPSITEKLAVWPGDTPMSREVLMDMTRGDNITLSTLRATMHLGAHADGPNHYGKMRRQSMSACSSIFSGLAR